MDSSNTQHQSNNGMNQLKGSADSCAKQPLPPRSEEIYYTYHYMMVEFYEQTRNFDQLLLLRVAHSNNIESLRDGDKASELCEKIDDVIESLKSRQSAIKKSASTMKQKRDGEKYPEINHNNRQFFVKEYRVDASCSKDGKMNKVLPADELLHRIYDITKGWNPKFRESVHKWRVMYETLLRLRYFVVGEKKRYADFVVSVVRYCFPLSEGGGKDSYSNNISKSALHDRYEMWSEEDKLLYKSLKDALIFE